MVVFMVARIATLDVGLFGFLVVMDSNGRSVSYSGIVSVLVLNYDRNPKTPPLSYDSLEHPHHKG